MEIKIGNKNLTSGDEVLFIADIGANHDGNIERAKDLIRLAKDAGADVAKFQHFQADTIVSKTQFDFINDALSSHQSGWEKSVYEVYKDASISLDWTQQLRECCELNDIEFMTSPYSMDLVDYIAPYVNAYKIGSGDITWHELLNHIATKGKPMILACGASTQAEVISAVGRIEAEGIKPILLQCNTNYTASAENFDYINLNVIDTFSKLFSGLTLGLSDHTPGHVTVLGAIAKGARVIEKHFTDDNSRLGPDHKFAMDPKSWEEMVKDSVLLLRSLGDGVKRIEPNELSTAVVQRRSIKLTRDLSAGTTITREDLIPLRPRTAAGLSPADIDWVVGKRIKSNLPRDFELTKDDLI